MQSSFWDAFRQAWHEQRHRELPLKPREDSALKALFETPLSHMIESGESPRVLAASMEARFGRFVSIWFTAAFLALGPIIIFRAIYFDRPPLSAPAIAVVAAAYLVIAWLEYQSAIRIAGAVDALPEPYAVHLALSIKRFPIALRPFPALWWLAHAAVILLLGQLFHKGASIPDPGIDAQRALFRHIINFGFSLGFAYASNTYLLLAVAALIPRERFLRILWHLRIPFDLALAFILPVVLGPIVTALPALIRPLFR